MRFRTIMFSLALLLASTVAQAAPDPGDCDRSGDNQITTRDALIALREAVNTCVVSYVCDVNGDEDTTTTDALLLLRVAVNIPTPTQCSCMYYDECFNDVHCADREFGQNVCVDYTCVQCEYDTDCSEGETCDGCHGECLPGAQ